MTKYELYSLLLAGLAALGALVVWFGQRKLQREGNDMQRATATLAKKQLEMLLREEVKKNKARLSLTLTRQDASSFRFHLLNVGEVDARDVEARLVLDKSAHSPIIPKEYAERFPIKCLRPGESVSLHAVLTLNSPTVFNAVLHWTDPDGSRVAEETVAAL